MIWGSRYTSASRGAALHLDKNRKTASVTPLPPCPGLAVRSPLPSRMSLLAQQEKKLEELASGNPTDAEIVEAIIQAYNTILMRRINRSGLEPSTIHTFTSLLYTYKKQRRTGDMVRLRTRFAAVFREDFLPELDLSSIPSELIFLAAMSGTPQMLRF